ncbi:synaptic glycoprotein SC2, putative [Entamoeba histolytica HM-3:IMSS]|nr:synaptic glycoprotein SC2, putative [Entamoeba histolytica HM-3:IMSS]
MVKIIFNSLHYSLPISLNKTVREMKVEIEKLCKIKPCQQRIWYYTKENKKVILLVDKTLTECGVNEETELEMKDLGRQLPYRFVYLLEYIGPLVLYFIPFFILKFLNRTILYQQYMALFLWVVHYLKRILETIYVHEFGDNTMPYNNVFKNCTYYWGFALAVSINVNLFSRQVPDLFVSICACAMLISIISNGYCHLLLKWLRPPGTQIRAIPKGFLFEYVSCPHYFCEIMTWIFFNALTGFPFFGVLFSLCGIYQMREWALQKHQRYYREFPDYPKNRTVLIPFLY